MINRLIDRKRLPEGKAYDKLVGEAACPESLKTQFPPQLVYLFHRRLHLISLRYWQKTRENRLWGQIGLAGEPVPIFLPKNSMKELQRRPQPVILQSGAIPRGR
jgi:hypothetical protein